MFSKLLKKIKTDSDIEQATPVADEELQHCLDLIQQGHYSAAESDLSAILQRQPTHTDARYYRVVALLATSRLGEAYDEIKKCLAVAPENSQYLFTCGDILLLQEQYQQAIDYFRQAQRLQPDSAEIEKSWAMALHNLGQIDEAMPHYQQAVALNPDLVEAQLNLAILYRDQSRYDEALYHYGETIRLQPDCMPALNSMGVIYDELGDMANAVRCLQQCLETDPDYAAAHNNLGLTYMNMGDSTLAARHFERAIELDEPGQQAVSNMLMNLNYQPEQTPDAIYQAHRQWAQQQAPAPMPAVELEPAAQRRLRIGYVSPDFRTHSVAFFIEPILEHHDRERFEIFAYYNHHQEDAVTQRIKQQVEHWRPVADLSDEELVQLIRQDQIDILVDLAGHTAMNRMRVFAMKPAPLQVTYLGYPNTTGLDSVDYRLTDAWADPPGQTEVWHSEQLLRLPTGFLCYQPPADCPAVGPLPALANGFITFGCFNNPAKVNPALIASWAAILKAVPDARLLLKARQFKDPAMRERFNTLFHDNGIDTQRIDYLDMIDSYQQHMDTYNRVDIALDSYPYNGTTTTCEALWMGVPVVTRAGQDHRSRVGLSLLSQLNLQTYAADTDEGYIETARCLAQDLSKLERERQRLRTVLQNASLMDAARLREHIEEHYQSIHEKYRDQLAT